jgi:peptide/nickel transport system substrate-binding protein
LRVDQEGRPQPWFAESWQVSPDGLLLTLKLRPHVTFNDGSPADATLVAAGLKTGLQAALASAYEDVDSISANGADEILVHLHRPSRFLVESLDTAIRKPANPAVGTAPFRVTPSNDATRAPSEMTAYERYYLGKPIIGRIVITTYPDTRAAWADMLRDRLDMLYEVGADAIESMQGASNVSLYTFDRPYQYLVFLNTQSPKLRSAEVRRALNQAIDRAALIRDGLSGHGTPSAGPVSPHHWAFGQSGTTFTYEPGAAAATLAAAHNGRLALKCLTPAEPPYENLALVLKRQLQSVGVDLTIDEIAPDNIVPTWTKHDFEMVLVDAATGWSLFRPYRVWHSKGNLNFVGFSSSRVDDALERIRHSIRDDDYRGAVGAFQSAIAADPPVIFLAWGSRSRAISHRFDVQAEPGRDVLATLRLWRPTAEKMGGGHN